jgi:NAD-dependent dihydropyrimidine dehydrogenase PreA subunit/flavodoxin
MVFYFSGTGNTRWAAERLAEATGERLLFIPEELNTDCNYLLEDDERIGFCFPVHGWQPPHIVRRFISRLTISSSHYTYALCTCGDSIGLAMQMFRDDLAAKGITLDSCRSLIMPESYVCLPFMYTDTPEREREKKQQARIDLDEYLQVVVQRQVGYSQLTLGLAPWTLSHVIGVYFNRFMITDKKFTVDADVCIHCGRCAEVCPVGDITFENTPQWKNDSSCTCCLSCYHHCPVHAINYGRITRRRGQYYYVER